MTLDADALSHLKVKDLQRELKKRDLDTSGLKATLLQRLKTHLQQEKETTEVKEKCRHENSDNDKELTTNDKVEDNGSFEEDDKEHKSKQEQSAEEILQVKRGAAVADLDIEEDASSVKKVKLATELEDINSQPEDEDTEAPTPVAKCLDDTGDLNAIDDEHSTTLRIDNFIRPFTLNAVKALVQELGSFVENGFWMDAIKTHCFVTYPTAEIANKTSEALHGKVWPPENGRSLQVKFVYQTAMEISQSGEAILPSQPNSEDSDIAPSIQRQKVTIDDFFRKTETKPTLYYLPLTDEEVKESKQRPNQQPEGQPRKRRHRGGRKRNRRARFRR